MFIKEFKIRSNNQIKSSEKKNLIKEILKQYVQLSEEELKSLIRVKESEVNISKITTYDSIEVVAYFVDKIPYFFKIDKDDRFIPTVYFLWKFPNILPKFYTHTEVYNKYLLNGADLMMPGLITPGPVNLYTFKHIKKHDLVALCLNSNDAPIAIGKTYLSGEDMYMSAMKGKCLNILQIYQDNLWSLGDKSLQVPNIPIVRSTQQINEEIDKNKTDESKSEQATEVEQVKIETEELSNKVENLGITEAKAEAIQEENQEEQDKNIIDHEKLLTECFLSTVKFKSKEFKLPIIVSTFMKIMQSCCPPGVQYDLKQTKFKKMGVFLKEMELKGCIKTKELQKGVLSITEIQKENEHIRYFKKPEWMKEENQVVAIDKEDAQFTFEVNEAFKVDGNNEKFFKNYRKGDIITSGEVRSFIMNYIKEKQLQSKDDSKCFQPDEVLNKIFIPKSKQQYVFSYVEFFQILFERLTPMHLIKRVYKDKKERDEMPIVRKGKFQPVEFKLESRGGNKKVTCVSYLATFEIDPSYLTSKLRKDIGCSVTYSLVNESSTASTSNADYIIDVQGNQIHTISEILKNEFGIPVKYMQGLELGIKN